MATSIRSRNWSLCPTTSGRSRMGRSAHTRTLNYRKSMTDCGGRRTGRKQSLVEFVIGDSAGIAVSPATRGLSRRQ